MVRQHGSRRHVAAVDVEAHARIDRQPIGDRPGVLRVERCALRDGVRHIAVPEIHEVRTAVVVVVAAARVA